ncbi:putative tfiiic transcription initiation factor complex subunits tfc3 protein [Rosellinia necatrix]|uniref:Putative tfiiic transcription initiation factor complex subunits tfc3 protein n=1 Tax=Rosellinia necatrix TaxID=77044 RepID=A0A1W2TWW1_ROSNE|nr:putative tfiiic transcription initiation factor complex subunits tfc3 protein [Rosellinia necatrix]
MAPGLDELIESLLTEIAFSGVRGCSVLNLLTAVDSFYGSAVEGQDREDPRVAQGTTVLGHDARGHNARGHNARGHDASNYDAEYQQTHQRHDPAVASRVWTWLASRPDVSIGTGRAFNHLTLDQVLALPEEEESPSLGTAAGSSAVTSSRLLPNPRPSARTTKDGTTTATATATATATVRPRIHVSEERQWRTITGHGPDLKRVPFFEWRALVDIASVKEKGILQGDLVRLTGQDKRSLPTRTDALARKGYIIKQPIVLRGGKSSKLWLAQFAEYAKEHQEREGLDYDRLDLSRAALTSDLHPVPFCHKWNGDTIDYLALAQAFVAIVKAWALIRYCDARAKLGVEERVRQMRALAKTCRWLTNIGALSFVGAKFAGSNRLFKDCVKYIRDPSLAEWSHFRATPKTRMVVPSGRIGKRGEASRAVHASQRSGSRDKPVGKKRQSTKPRSDPMTHTSIIPLPWKPQKPLPNTAFEVIRRAGPKGTSNAAICRQTLGHNYKRLTAAMTGSISMPTNSQPPHLKHLSSTSQLSRIGKTMTYTFYANSEITDTGPSGQENHALDAIAETTSPANFVDTTASPKHSAFSQPNLSKFSPKPGLSLTEITRSQQLNRILSRKSKRKRSIDEESDDEPPVKLPRRLGRPPTRASIDELRARPTDQPSQLGAGDIPTTIQPQLNTEDQPAPRPPGVYRGLPNSLDPAVKRKGRKRKSLVLIFRSDKLKDPSFLGVPPAIADADGAGSSGHEGTIEATPRRLSIHVQDANMTDTLSADVATPVIASEGVQVKPRASKAKKNGSFPCDKCGNSWKNSNGLEYHLTKSRTACNPDFVPPPSQLANYQKRKSTQPQILAHPSAPRVATEDQGRPRISLTPKEQVESRFEQPKHSLSSRVRNSPSVIEVLPPLDEATTRTSALGDLPRAQPLQGGIILKDLELYDATDHRRMLRQGMLGIHKGVSASSKSTPSAGTQESFTRGPLPPNRSPTKNGRMRNSNEDNQRGSDGQPQSSLNPDLSQMETAINDRSMTAVESSRDNRNSNICSGEVLIPMSPGRPNTRKPLPSIPHTRPDYPALVTPTLMSHVNSSPVHGTLIEAFTPSLYSRSLANDNIDQHSAHKPLSFFARPMRPNASFGARRRNRTMQIVEYLLAQNEGVFPGLRSLFMAVISVWAKEFRDLAPPDRRICQSAVNQMERDGVLKQMHFFFFDDQSKMQECVVLVKSDMESGLPVGSSDDPRVIAVKEKMREMFPETYVPNAFSLSPDEAKLFDELASQGKEHNQTRSLRGPKDLKKVQDIETLRYENSVMGNIAIHRANVKRQVDEAQAETQPPLKRARMDVEQPATLERARKPRRRPDKHEMWDSGKLAVYIWSQRQIPNAMWEQHRSCLQDPATGSWSWMPDTDPSQPSAINTILSSVKSARHIDASLKRKARRGWSSIDAPNGGNPGYPYGDQNTGEVFITAKDVLVADGYGFDGPDRTIRRSKASLSFGGDILAWDKDEGIYEDDSETSDEESTRSDISRVGFATSDALDGNRGGWPTARSVFSETQHMTSYPAIEPITNSFQLPKPNLPRNVHDILNAGHRVHSFKRWADPVYGKFLRNLGIIARWEQSADGVRAFTRETAVPRHIYLSLTLDEHRLGQKPTTLEWLSFNQLTPDNIPDEIKNTPPEDVEYGLSFLMAESRRVGVTNGTNRNKEFQTMGHNTTNNDSLRAATAPRKPFSRVQTAILPSPMTPPIQSEGFIEYKTRDLTHIPRQPRGRFNKPPAHDEKLGSKREDELVAACVVFRTLLGGLDRNLDIGLLLKHFPGMSLSAIKKFWPRISRERKSYVQALTAKFQSAFLSAYESGELPQLDYDDIENYDWPRLILWTTQLETHEDVDLPQSREALHQTQTIEDVTNEVVDWRETWFSTTSTYNRIEAVASETMSIPIPPKYPQDRAILERARTWVRSICCTSLRGVNVKERVIPRLLELGNGDVTETNRILEKAVAGLNREKVITRTKGKDLGGNFRIHGTFSKQLEKMAATPKFRQAIAFKSQLDEVFRHSDEYSLPYASDDGSVMAALNLQAHGRIRIETVGLPSIPFGFEPGNYEGRTFPKSYYHFKMRLVPTEKYLFDEDMALLEQARRMEPPTQGPGGKIPIWVDFFGKVDTARWADYVSMIVFTLAIKGPIVPRMCVTLLKPMIDEFEVQLIVDWLDGLGLIQRAVNGCGVTSAEWWWLVAGHVVQASGRAVGKHSIAG